MAVVLQHSCSGADAVLVLLLQVENNSAPLLSAKPLPGTTSADSEVTMANSLRCACPALLLYAPAVCSRLPACCCGSASSCCSPPPV